MSLQVEKLEHNMAKLTVEVAAEDVEKATAGSLLKTAQNRSTFRDSVKAKLRENDRADVRKRNFP